MVRYAKSHGVTDIRVEQICEWSQHGEGGEDDDDQNNGETDGGGRNLVFALSTHKTEARVPFNGREKHTVSSPSLPAPPAREALGRTGADW